jgi:hypothetical protein
MANYSDAFSKSFASNTFVTESIPGLTDSFRQNIDLSNIDFNKAANLEFNPIAFDPGLDLMGSAESQGWTFITAPEDVSWDIANGAQRIDIFGTNSPPVVAGSRGMRDLSLGNALVEGFVRNVTVEGKISALESLMNYKLNASDGFVSVPVYQVWANEKAYGNGYYIIKDIQIKEKMRDLRGDATRAYVDVSFMEVPAYQVNSGRDLASKPAAAAKALALPDPKQTRAAQQTATQQAAAGQVDKNLTPKSGPGVPKDNPAAKPAAAPARPKAVIPGQEIRYSGPPR